MIEVILDLKSWALPLHLEYLGSIKTDRVRQPLGFRIQVGPVVLYLGGTLQLLPPKENG